MDNNTSKVALLSDIKRQLQDSAAVKERLASDYSEKIWQVSQLLVDTIRKGAKILFCGNGGSAADAQHLVAELVARLCRERQAIPALALTVNTSTLSAIANDDDYSAVFVRQLEAFGKKGDVLVGISTSGNSENVLKACEYAGRNAITTLALTGGDGGKLAQLADYCITVPSDDVQRIQEAHITIGHILCDILEQSVINQ
jgi:D-sedoheptulose 7-phosphate isomerase